MIGRNRIPFFNIRSCICSGIWVKTIQNERLNRIGVCKQTICKQRNKLMRFSNTKLNQNIRNVTKSHFFHSKGNCNRLHEPANIRNRNWVLFSKSKSISDRKLAFDDMHEWCNTNCTKHSQHSNHACFHHMSNVTDSILYNVTCIPFDGTAFVDTSEKLN